MPQDIHPGLTKTFNICIFQAVSKIHPSTLSEKTYSTITRLFDNYPKNLRFHSLGSYSDPRDIVSNAHEKPCDLAVIIVGSGGTEHIIVDAVSKLSMPILLIAFDGYNSLPALAEAASYLREKNYRFLYSFIELAKINNYKERISSKLRSILAYLSFKGSKIGVIGGISPWLVYSNVSGSELRSLLGTEIIDISIDRLVSYYEGVEPDDMLVKRFQALASDRKVSESIRSAVRLYLAIKKLIEEYNLDAATINCFAIAERLKVTPCLAVALLNSEGIILGCEGDVPALLTVMANYFITGKPSFIGNTSMITGNELVISHCTIPLAMASSYKLTTHFETGLGVSVSGRLPMGRNVVVSKLDPRKRALLVLDGKIRDSVPRYTRLCRTQLTIEFNRDIEDIIDAGVGNHLVVTLGTHSAPLRDLGRILGWKIISL
ncbi:MAG: hypothetical protein GSR77_01160 [Desulfurococcales archaeon]|nr:hypothetical protein [Desulfurococcales archaeon]